MSDHPRMLLQRKVFELLSTDVDLKGLLRGEKKVLDYVPDNPEYPYVTIGDIDHNDFGSHTHDGVDSVLMIHVWSQLAGKSEAMQIQNRIYQLLHDVDLQIDSFPTVNCRETFSQVLKDPDGKTHHGVSQYSIILGGNN